MLYRDAFLVLIKLGCNLLQKLKTRHVKNDCNPAWNDELTLAITDVDVPINLVSTPPGNLGWFPISI